MGQLVESEKVRMLSSVRALVSFNRVDLWFWTGVAHKLWNPGGATSPTSNTSSPLRNACDARQSVVAVDRTVGGR